MKIKLKQNYNYKFYKIGKISQSSRVKSFKGNILKDIFLKSQKEIVNRKNILQRILNTNPNDIIYPETGLSEIVNISDEIAFGTACSGSIPMKNFWKGFKSKERKKLMQIGLSTNKDGYPHCFLKAAADIPLSTSFVHNCSIMYLFNSKTNTHALYHASSNCTLQNLKFILKILMPEGITHGAIKPGDAKWYKQHHNNMINMLAVMKKSNPEAIVNVYHDSSKYPECVGYKGVLFEIPNTQIKKKLSEGDPNFCDEGQASFKIMDLQGINTFDLIKKNTQTPEDIEKLRNEFKSKGYNKEIINILNNILDKRLSVIKSITECKTIEEIDFVECELLSRLDSGFDLVILKTRENILINELEKVTNEKEFIDFCLKVKRIPSCSQMNELYSRIAKKRASIL